MSNLIRFTDCGNIESGEIEIHLKRLNIKYGANGTGKSTIAKAILSNSSSEHSGLRDELLPFKLRSSTTDRFPKVVGVSEFQNVKVFNEEYIQNYQFKGKEIQDGSYEIYVRTPAVRAAEAEVEQLTESIRQSATNNDSIIILECELRKLIELCGKPTKKGISKASGLAKAAKASAARSNLPKEFELYKSFLYHPENYIWLKWQSNGTKYFDETCICPYCTSSVDTKQDIIRSISKQFSSPELQKLFETSSAIDNLQEYVNPSIFVKLKSALIENQSGELSHESQLIISTLQRQGYELLEALRRLKEITYHKLKDISAIVQNLSNLRIEITQYNSFCDCKTSEEVAKINKSVDSLNTQVGLLKSKISNLTGRLASSIKRSNIGINQFLSDAGYPYSVNFDQHGEQYKMSIVHKDYSEALDDPTRNLSYGEKNALALVLFVYDALNSNADLIVLDDPISSFDRIKKYAVLVKLFGSQAMLRDKTVLLLTHDQEPLIDMLCVHKNRFSTPIVHFIEAVGGVLTEKIIEESDLISFTKLMKSKLVSSNREVCKLIYLRRLIEIDSFDTLIYHFISSILHGDDPPQKKGSNGELVAFTTSEIEEASLGIIEFISDFKYLNAMANISSRSYMISAYNNSICRFEKLQLFRVIHESWSLATLSESVMKIINMSYHIENEFLFQLDPQKFCLVPGYVSDQCDLIVTALTIPVVETAAGS